MCDFLVQVLISTRLIFIATITTHQSYMWKLVIGVQLFKQLSKHPELFVGFCNENDMEIVSATKKYDYSYIFEAYFVTEALRCVRN